MPIVPRQTTDTARVSSAPLSVTQRSAADSPDAGCCPLCGAEDTIAYTEDRFRRYRICRGCSLVFVPEQFHVSARQEKARYDLHRNHPDDPGYRAFLSRLFNPLRQRLAEDASGLDFGSGPGPALPAMLRELGYRIDIFDKFYACDESVFNRKYDFITAAEVLEHLCRPGFELCRLYGMLNPGGILGIMTKLVIDRQAFDTWHYKNDKTHICFFSRQTFQWLAGALEAQVEFIGKDVVLLQKKAP